MTPTTAMANGKAALLEAKDVQCGYGSRTIVHSAHANIQPGSVTTVIGANGSGKPTFLRSLSGLLKPSAGSIQLNGNHLSSLKPRDTAKELAFLPQ